MLCISWLNFWVIKLPQPPWALLVQLLAPRLKATHTMSRRDRLIKCHISCTRQDSMLDQNDLLFWVVHVDCSLDSRKQRKSPGMGHMTHCSSTAVSFDCGVSPCRHHPLQNKALIELLALCVCMCVSELARTCVLAHTCWPRHRRPLLEPPEPPSSYCGVKM